MKISIENQKILAFIKDKGGEAEVAKKIGKHPTVFYNIEREGVTPSFKTLLALKAAYPDLDLNWIAGDVEANYTKIELPESEKDKMIEELKSNLEKAKKRIEELEDDKRTLGRIVNMIPDSFQSLNDDAPSEFIETKILEIPKRKIGFDHCRKDSVASLSLIRGGLNPSKRA